jgi:hypothetical protein
LQPASANFAVSVEAEVATNAWGWTVAAKPAREKFTEQIAMIESLHFSFPQVCRKFLEIV